MGGCQGKHKEKNRDSDTATKYRPVVTKQRQLERKSTELRDDIQTGNVKEIQPINGIPDKEQANLSNNQTTTLKSQQQDQCQKDDLQSSNVKGANNDGLQNNGDEKVNQNQEGTLEGAVGPDYIDETELKTVPVTSSTSETANFGYHGPNFAKGSRPLGVDESMQPPSLDGPRSLPPSQSDQMDTGNQNDNNRVISSQNRPLTAANSEHIDTTGNPGNVSRGANVEQPESTIFQTESSSSGGANNNSNKNNKSSTFEPSQPMSAQNPQLAESEDTKQILTSGNVNPAGAGTSGVDHQDHPLNAEFAKPVDYEDDEYRKIMGLNDESNDFEGFVKTDKSKKNHPTVTTNSQNRSHIENNDSDDDSSDDSEDSDEDDDDDTDSDESSSDEEPKFTQRKRKNNGKKVEINYIKGAQFAAIGKNAKYIDMRKMPAPVNKTKKKKKTKKARTNPGLNQKEKDPNEQKNTSVKPPAAARPDNTDKIENLKVVVKAADSVGIICGPNDFSGTGFRVGDKYVMTAWHVVEDIVGKGLHKNEYNLRNEDVYVDFQYHNNRHITSARQKFFISPSVDYFNEDLDVAVLKLQKKDSEELPPPLTLFKDIDPTKYRQPIYLVGHTGGKPKEDDPKITIWNPYPDRVKELRDWIDEVFTGKRDGYAGIEHPQKFIFDCTFRHGASGSPGVSRGDKDNPVVVTILLRGYPDFYYYADFTESEKAKVPPEKMKQQGVRIKAVMDDMKKENPGLYNNIFCQHQNTQQNVSVGHTFPHSPISSPVTEGPSFLTTSSTSGLLGGVVQPYN